MKNDNNTITTAEKPAVREEEIWGEGLSARRPSDGIPCNNMFAA